MRRVDCRRCGVVAVEEVPWGDGKRTLTKAYMLFLAGWARRRTSRKVAADPGRNQDAVLRLLIQSVPEVLRTNPGGADTLVRAGPLWSGS
jgi:hypothetical protein